MIQNFIKNTKGAVSVSAIIWFVSMVIVGGLAVDVTNAFRVRTIMQATADAATLAAMKDLPDAAQTKDRVEEYVLKNMPIAKWGAMIDRTDILVGRWDGVGKTFLPNDPTSNALKITLVSSANRGNSVSTILLSLIGKDSWELSADAVASKPLPPELCPSQPGGAPTVLGAMAGGEIDLNMDFTLNNGTCMYGRSLFSSGSNGDFSAPGARVGTLSKSNFKFNSGVLMMPNTAFTADLQPTRAQQIGSTIDDWASGVNIPSGMTAYFGNPTSSLPSTLTDNTLYVLNDNIKVKKAYSATNVIIATLGDIKWGTGGSIVNSSPTGCEDGKAIGIYAKNEIKFGTGVHMEGVEVVTAHNIDIGMSSLSKNVSFEAAKNIKINSNGDFSGCARRTDIPGSPVPLGSIGLRL